MAGNRNFNKGMRNRPYFERIAGYNAEMQKLKTMPLTAEEYESRRKDIERKWRI